MNKVIITTTNQVNHRDICDYLGLVTSNLVIGTNVFSDFVASFSDFFGGMSGTYRNQLDTLYKRAIDDLSEKATLRGADAILGVKIDFDEISGKGKSMFMVSITGTAVKLSDPMDGSNRLHEKTISSRLVEIELFKQEWFGRHIDTYLPNEKDWSMIFSNNLLELAPSLYRIYVRVCQYTNGQDSSIIEKFPQFISTLSYDDAVDIMYFDYENLSTFANNLIRDNKLFCPVKVLDLLKSEKIDLAINLLAYDKFEYTHQDIVVMGQIVKWLDNLPNKGSVQQKKAGLLSSKMEDKYICQNGHTNSADIEFCGNCGLNIKGLNSSQVALINKFRYKFTVLRGLMQE
ncbi:MAG: YbjQ family protein [Alistipes sp.]|nr:YbjQ family protein [Alistipes sp.]